MPERGVASSRCGSSAPGVLYFEPLLAVVEGILDVAECRHLVMLARPRLTRSAVLTQSRSVLSNVRTGYQASLAPDHDAVTRRVVKRISRFVDLPCLRNEALQVACYFPGQQFKIHCDASLDPPRSQALSRRARHTTALVYLSDRVSGGETRFPALGITIWPRRGRLVVWENCYVGTDNADPMTAHEACLVRGGEKWVLTIWFGSALADSIGAP